MLIKESYLDKANSTFANRNMSKISYQNVKLKVADQRNLEDRSMSTYSVLKIQNKNAIPMRASTKKSLKQLPQPIRQSQGKKNMFDKDVYTSVTVNNNNQMRNSQRSFADFIHNKNVI
jgi:hypothetical protein